MKPKNLKGWNNMPNREIYDRFSSIECSPSHINKLYQELKASLDEAERLKEKLASLQGAYLKSVERDNNLTEEIFASKSEVERLMKALKSLVCVAEKDEINKNHLDQALRKARNVIADIDPTIEKCDCCY